MKKVVTSVFLGILMAGALSASAATIYTIDNPNSAISSFTGPYGEVAVSLTDSTHAIITFTANSGFLFGGEGIGALQISGSWSLGTLPSGMTDIGSGNVSEFGVFDQVLKEHGGFQEALSSFSFDLTATGGTTWSSDANVLELDSLGHHVAAHIFVIDPNGNGALATGFATDNGSSVPDGASTVALLGFALVGLETLRRKIRG
jgi:VPDSG-CTERM motif